MVPESPFYSLFRFAVFQSLWAECFLSLSSLLPWFTVNIFKSRDVLCEMHQKTGSPSIRPPCSPGCGAQNIIICWRSQPDHLPYVFGNIPDRLYNYPGYLSICLDVHVTRCLCAKKSVFAIMNRRASIQAIGHVMTSQLKCSLEGVKICLQGSIWVLWAQQTDKPNKPRFRSFDTSQ